MDLTSSVGLAFGIMLPNGIFATIAGLVMHLKSSSTQECTRNDETRLIGEGK